MIARRIGTAIGILLALAAVSAVLSYIISKFKAVGGWSWMLLAETAGAVFLIALLRWLWNRRKHVESIA